MLFLYVQIVYDNILAYFFELDYQAYFWMF